MEKSAQITKNKHSTRRSQKGIQKDVLWIKRKNGKNFPTETEYPTTSSHFAGSNNSRYVWLPETLAKEKSIQHILYVGINNSVNETSRDVLN